MKAITADCYEVKTLGELLSVVRVLKDRFGTDMPVNTYESQGMSGIRVGEEFGLTAAYIELGGK